MSGGHESSEKMCVMKRWEIWEIVKLNQNAGPRHITRHFSDRGTFSRAFVLEASRVSLVLNQNAARPKSYSRTVICRRFSHRLEGLVVGRCFLFARSVFLSCRPFQNTLVFIERGSDILYQQREWARAGQAGGGFRQNGDFKVFHQFHRIVSGRQRRRSAASKLDANLESYAQELRFLWETEKEVRRWTALPVR